MLKAPIRYVGIIGIKLKWEEYMKKEKRDTRHKKEKKKRRILSEK